MAWVPLSSIHFRSMTYAHKLVHQNVYNNIIDIKWSKNGIQSISFAISLNACPACNFARLWKEQKTTTTAATAEASEKWRKKEFIHIPVGMVCVFFSLSIVICNSKSQKANERGYLYEVHTKQRKPNTFTVHECDPWKKWGVITMESRRNKPFNYHHNIPHSFHIET